MVGARTMTSDLLDHVCGDLRITGQHHGVTQ